METTMESLDAIMAAYEDRNLSPTETLIMKAIWMREQTFRFRN